MVAMPTMSKAPRMRKTHDRLKANCESFEVGPGASHAAPGAESDMQFVARMYQEQCERSPGFTMLDPTAPVLIARHKITRKPYGMLVIKPIPPGKMFVEALLVDQSRLGRMAARALCERVMEMAVKKVCGVAAYNPSMLRILEHYGGKVVGYLVEGPYEGATEVSAAAEPMESYA